MVEWKRGSMTWKYMLKARVQFDQEIWWEPKYGHSSIWYDNWIQFGALHYYLLINLNINHQYEEVRQRLTKKEWNTDIMQHLFTTEVYNHVLQHILCEMNLQERDKPRWMLNNNGYFSIGSSWDCVRKRKEH